MDKQATIKELIDQAKNARRLVYEVAAAYIGVPPEKVAISAIEDNEQGQK